MTDWTRFRQTTDGKWIDLARPYLPPANYAASFLAVDDMEAELKASGEWGKPSPAGKKFMIGMLIFWLSVIGFGVYAAITL